MAHTTVVLSPPGRSHLSLVGSLQSLVCVPRVGRGDSEEEGRQSMGEGEREEKIHVLASRLYRFHKNSQVIFAFLHALALLE